jgi:mannose-6-phosphate isomerase-like protein (cupin superfamily)
MKKLICAIIVTILMLPLLAQAPQGFKMWTAAELKGFAAKLGPKINAQKFATENLVPLGGNNTMVVHRQGDGEAEIHDAMADFTIIESGEGTLVIGGTAKDGKNTGPGETRGSGIDGGQSYKVSPGDIFFVPAKTPHQMKVAKGGQVTYFVLKVPAK